MTRIAIISDTHSLHDRFGLPPPCDIFIHCGDFTEEGDSKEVNEFNRWLAKVPVKYKVILPGNHDLVFEDHFGLARGLLTNATHVLNESELSLLGVRIWGSPWTPWFHDWAFNYRKEDATRRWMGVPEGLDILVTHGPPLGILDSAPRPGGTIDQVGCPKLAAAVMENKPKYHVFGHIHESPGQEVIGGTTYINASAPLRRGRGLEPYTVIDI